MVRETPPELRRQLEELRDLPTAALAERFETLAGHPPHTRNRSYLRRRVAWLIQSHFYGETLSEATRQRAHELARLSDLRLTPPVPAASRTVRRQLAATRDPKLPPPGTVLVRGYQGREVRVVVLDDGFEHDGIVYRSLSAIANKVTGTHCSGPRWFALVERKPR